MQQFSFEALGTVWTILIDSAQLSEDIAKKCIDKTAQFEQQFSRFQFSSEVNAYRDLPAGTYDISPTFFELLEYAQRLKKLTHGLFDPAVATILEKAGYNKDYTFTPEKNIEQSQIQSWSVKNQELTISGPMSFDLGGFGKGYWIDQLSKLVMKLGYQHHLVEGGGDMAGTSKKDGAAWQIAIEWPGKPDLAVGLLELKDSALAVSDIFKRRWSNWHHVIDPITKKPITAVIGCAVHAPTAIVADSLTTALMVSKPDQWPVIAKKYNAQYLLFTEDGKFETTPDWQGTFFT